MVRTITTAVFCHTVYSARTKQAFVVRPRIDTPTELRQWLGTEDVVKAVQRNGLR